MRYKPLFSKPQTLLQNLGYTDAENRGYELPHKPNKRFHAFIELDNTIDLHYDTPHPTKYQQHTSQKYGGNIRYEMKRIQKYDWGSASFWVLLKYKLIKWL